MCKKKLCARNAYKTILSRFFSSTWNSQILHGKNEEKTILSAGHPLYIISILTLMSSVPFLGLTTNFGCSCHVLRRCCTDCKEKGVCLSLRGVPTLFLRRGRLLWPPFVWFGDGIQPKLFFFFSGMIIIGLGFCFYKKMMGHFQQILKNPWKTLNPIPKPCGWLTTKSGRLCPLP